jgi:hypothetical protein
LSCESDSVSVGLAYHSSTALLAKRALKLYKEGGWGRVTWV